MVRLKENDKNGTRLFDIFQFHYGTIKRLQLLKWKNKVEKFQFHYGTIKSDSSNNVYYYDIRFQFHYGTIKRGMAMVPLSRCQVYFNSTMVRLKALQTFLETH